MRFRVISRANHNEVGLTAAAHNFEMHYWQSKLASVSADS